MVVLGPDTVKHGVDPERGFIAFSSEGMCYLGPTEGPSTEVDPINHLFVVLGKLISARRVVAQDRLMDPRPPAAIENYGALQELILGFAENDPDEFDVVWQPLAKDVQRHAIDPLQANVADLDQRTRRFIATETQTLLALDTRATVEQRMEAVDTYLKVKGFTVEQASGGFRDFIAQTFVGSDGRRINLPTASDPSFPDSWITPEVVDPQAHGPSRRSWNIIW